MPAHPRSYSPAAAERLRRALLALAASAATLTSHAQDAEGDFEDPDVLGEIPEDIEEGGAYAFFPCSNPGCKAEDCEGECQDGEPCAGCDTQRKEEKDSHAEGAEPESVPEPRIRGEAPRMPTHGYASTNVPPNPIKLTEADLEKRKADGFEVPSGTNAPPREAGSVPEASASGSVLVPTNRIILLGGLRTFH